MFKVKILNPIALILLTMACVNQVIAAPAQGDLIPIAEGMKSGKVVVKNMGKAVSRVSWLTIECVAKDCPEDASMAAYENPLFPNVAAIKVPALKPGQSYSHQLSFWQQLNFMPGKYKFVLRADAGSDIPESNETNNVATYIKSVKAFKTIGLSAIQKDLKNTSKQEKLKLKGDDEWPVCIPSIGHTCPP
ncbi:MAG: CARDB domain-containing protein [Gammaproteobacteria bacterium]